MSILAICDELATLIEPDASLRDDTRARPVAYPAMEADRLALWPVSETFAADTTGDTDEERFRVRIAWTADASFEQASGTRERSTADLIVAKADAIATVVRQNRAALSFEWVQVDRVDYETLTTLETRGLLMDLSGYQGRI